MRGLITAWQAHPSLNHVTSKVYLLGSVKFILGIEVATKIARRLWHISSLFTRHPGESQNDWRCAKFDMGSSHAAWH